MRWRKPHDKSNRFRFAVDSRNTGVLMFNIIFITFRRKQRGDRRIGINHRGRRLP